MGADILFSGSVFRRKRDNASQVFDCTAYDRGIYLKKNETYLAVRNQTPEAVTAQICREFNIKFGSLAATGIKLSRNFLGVSLYQIIQTMYTPGCRAERQEVSNPFSGRHAGSGGEGPGRGVHPSGARQQSALLQQRGEHREPGDLRGSL